MQIELPPPHDDAYLRRLVDTLQMYIGFTNQEIEELKNEIKKLKEKKNG